MNDRIRAPRLPADHTAHEELPHRITTMPSLAAQLLLAAANHLVKVKDDQPLTIAGWGHALALADSRTPSGYPQAVAHHSACRAMSALSADLWASARTRGEWAVLLRSAARTV
ncbi:hypothetical protein ABZY45_14350 [Streptomyces sp. NPDC006516]|uniref:hypothetical protein n=1 Tax=Streptomyces sp. NPDC006516 TaxID=3154309 RepID=UPI0033B51727